MANGTCDICGIRPATVRAQVVTNGRRETMELCDLDYRRLARQQRRSSSPLESLFGMGRGGSLFEDFFDGGPFGGRDDEDGAEPIGGTSIPVRTGGDGGARHRRASTLGERLSAHAQEMLQAAARRA